MTEQTESPIPSAPPQQLRMIWPASRLHAPPPVTVHPDYEVRTYRPGDEEPWYRLMDEAGFTGWDGQQLAPLLATVLPNGWFLAVHKATGALCASAMASHAPIEHHPFGGALNWVCGDPIHAGKGLGMAVCAAVTARLLGAGYQNIYLLTDDWRLPALTIYLNLGYQPLLFQPDMEGRWRAIYAQLGRAFTVDG